MSIRAKLLAVACLAAAAAAPAQLKSLATDDLTVIYFPITGYLSPYAAQCFTNALRFHEKTFAWTPSDRLTVFLDDFGDAGNAGASAVPGNHVSVTVSPFSYTFETVLGNERINWVASHELVHVLASDGATARDRRFRTLFAGKVAPESDNPLSLLYAWLTTPRTYAPRWWQEGIAMFMETWMSGGLGRTMGAYDEMVFRTLVAEDREIYDMVGLDSAASKLDFQVGVNAYLYGGRFDAYIADTYGPEKLLEWVARKEGSEASYSAEFEKMFGKPLPEAWSDWIAWERTFQRANLERLRANPITPFRPLSERALGSVSPAVVDRAAGVVYLGVHQPGHVAHISALALATGELTHIVDVKGPALFSVTSLALDPKSQTLFYTTDNNDWRDLRGIDLKRGRSRTYQKDTRIGDLAFSEADGALWGVRHYNGISTLVRIPPPYSDWNQIHSFPYGTDIYDLAISPDGTRLVAALSEISGNQSLVMMEVAKLLAGDATYAVLSEFENSSPANFVFSPDGRVLYGSSYYSGVSNLYRYDLESRDISALTNADTGFFRPVPLEGGSLLAFRYTAQGFQPVLLDPQPVEKVNAITFLGQEIVEKHPVVTSWQLPPPSSVDLEPLVRSEGDYNPFSTVRLRSLYPILEGYKDYAAVGARLNLSDPLGLNRLALSASFAPSEDLPSDERLHLKATYRHLGWKAEATLNNADFYDFFGPTKRSLRGYSGGLEYKRYLIFDEPKRYLDWQAGVTAYGNLETVPGAQNVASSASSLVHAEASIGYRHERSSLGAVAPEKGVVWRATAYDRYGLGQHFPALALDFDFGVPLPIRHSSVWLRTAAGAAAGDRDEPFANFYFGGFGNNWVDDKPYRRLQEAASFPGVEINEVGGRNFAKAMLQLELPPVVFKHVGSPSLFFNWASVTLFTTGLATNLDDEAIRREVVNLGAQLDLRFVALSRHQFTLSFGYAVADEKDRDRTSEFMASLRIPLYE